MKKNRFAGVWMIVALLITLAPVRAGAAITDWSVPWRNSDVCYVGAYDIHYEGHATQSGGRAVDFLNAGNIPLYAPCDGTVTILQHGFNPKGYYGCKDGRGGYGNHVEFRTDDGYTVVMAHFNDIDQTLINRFDKGDRRITRGTYLGRMGTSGNSTGIHLHFEVITGKSVLATVFGKSESELTKGKAIRGGIDESNTARQPVNPSAEPKVIMAYPKQNSVQSGDSVWIYAKTNDIADRVALINERGETAAGSSVPTTDQNGEKEWDFQWKTQDTGSRNLVLRAYAGDQYVDYAISAAVIAAPTPTTAPRPTSAPTPTPQPTPTSAPRPTPIPTPTPQPMTAPRPTSAPTPANPSIPSDAVKYEGNYYKVYYSDATWVEADQICGGLGGHLCTVTSAGESRFIKGLPSESSRFLWLGAADADAGGSWTWVTGEQFSYTDWLPGEPNGEGRETYLLLTDYYTGSWGWNDGTDEVYSGMFGYICEWEGGSQ
ncbi:MAG: peptidoglycan DD-metalloendopeptidase family protein [Peptococcaceae bacterium]|nr:peptidoglycan DD-metalloendopeptidase family protein [Peptococcaceae bacterium]